MKTSPHRSSTTARARLGKVWDKDEAGGHDDDLQVMQINGRVSRIEAAEAVEAMEDA